MNTNIADSAEKKTACAKRETKIKLRWPAFLLVPIFAALGAAGCGGYYSAYPGYGPNYGPGPYYGGRHYYGGYPGSVTVEVGDRPYYVRGPGYYSGRTYYAWRSGHWATRHGRRVWIHGRYFVR